MVPLYFFQTVRKYLNTSVQTAIKYSLITENSKVLVKLQFRHISGALGIWSMGLILSCIAFLYELYTYYSTVQKFVH